MVWWCVAWRDFGVRGGVGVGLARRGVVWRAVAWCGVVWCGVEALTEGALERSESETGNTLEGRSPSSEEGVPTWEGPFQHLAFSS